MGVSPSSLTPSQSREAIKEHSAQVVAMASVAATRDRFKVDTITDDVLYPSTFNVYITIVGADGRSGQEHLLQVASTSTAFGSPGQLDTFFIDEEGGAVVLPPRGLHFRVSRSLAHALDDVNHIMHTKMRWTLGFASVTFFGDASWWADGDAPWDVSVRGDERSPNAPGQWDLLPGSITMAPPSVSGIAHVHSHGPAHATLPFPAESEYVETRTIATAALCGGVGADVDTLYTLRELMPRMRTGDVVLYNSEGITGPVTRAVTGLPFSHAGIIVIEDTAAHRGCDGSAAASAPSRPDGARVERGGSAPPRKGGGSREAYAKRGECARVRERRSAGSHVALAYESTPNHCGTRDFALEEKHSQMAEGFAGVFGFSFIERVLAYQGDVLWAPLKVDLDDAHAANLAAFVRGHHLAMTRYDFTQFLTAAVHRFSGGVVDINGADDDAEMFCSEFVGEALKVGFDVSTHDDTYSSFRLSPRHAVDASVPIAEQGRQVFAAALADLSGVPYAEVVALERTHTQRLAPGDLYKLALLEKVSLLKATTQTMRVWARQGTHTVERRRRVAAREALHVIGRRKASRWGSYANASGSGGNTSISSIATGLLVLESDSSGDSVESDSSGANIEIRGAGRPPQGVGRDARAFRISASSAAHASIEERRTSSLSAVDSYLHTSRYSYYEVV